MNRFFSFLIASIFILTACKSEKDKKAEKQEVETPEISEILRGLWSITDVKYNGVLNPINQEDRYLYYFEEDSTFEIVWKTGSFDGKFHVQEDTIWMLADEAEMDSQFLIVFDYFNDTLIVGGSNDEREDRLEMTMVNLKPNN